MMRRASLQLLPLEDRITPAVAYALSDNSLIAFDTASPTVVTSPIPVTGLGTGESLVGIDFRPQNGMLYGLTANGVGVRLYAISQRSGVATPLTSGFQRFDDGAGNPVSVVGTRIGFHFDPSIDRVRVVTDAGENFRIDPNTGLIVDGDTSKPGVNPDDNLTFNGSLIGSEGAAYTNDVPNTGTTTLYTLDSTTQRIYRQSGATSGNLTDGVPITANGAVLNFTAVEGFSIPVGVDAPQSGAGANGQGLAVLQVGGKNLLYRVQLSGVTREAIFPSVGGAILVGTVGDGSTPIQGFAIDSDTGSLPVEAVLNGNSLVRFGSATSMNLSTIVPIGGLNPGEKVIGIAERPATGQLYGVVFNGSGVRLAVIDPQTGATSTTGLLTTPQRFTDGAGNNVSIDGNSFGVTFDPVSDRIRVVSDTSFNFRIDPNTGSLVDGDFGLNATQPGINPDGSINSATTRVSGAAYTNGFAQGASAATTLYTLDANTDSLYQQIPVSGKQVNPLPITLGGTKLNFDLVEGFSIPAGIRVSASDIRASGRAVAALRVNGVTSLYSIELSTGVATLLGTVGDGSLALTGIALGDAPVGTIQFVSPTLSTKVNVGTTTLTLTRTGGSVGNLTVVIDAVGGTAIEGTDFVGVPITVSFADGQTTASVPLAIVNRHSGGANKTIDLSLSDASSGVALGADANAVLTILENNASSIEAVSIGGIVTTFNADGSVRLNFRPFVGFVGQVTVAQGDVNGDGVPDVIVGAGPGGYPNVAVFDGATGQQLASFFAFSTNFLGGVFVATSDVTGDGLADIIVGAGAGGGPHVKVFDGRTFQEIRSFYAFEPQFTGGVRVAGGDFNSDGIGDIAVAAGPGGGPHVRVLSGLDGSELLSYFAYDPGYTGGVYLASGDVNGDGTPDLISGAGTSTNVTVASGRDGSLLRSFYAGDPNFFGGVRVASIDLNADGFDDIATVPGPGKFPTVRTFDGRTLELLSETPLSDPTLFQGVFVG